MDNNNYDVIIELKRFINKYYWNKLITGVLFTLTVSIIYITAIIFVEYFSFLSVYYRTIIYFISLLVLGIILVFKIIIPTGKLLKIGKILSIKDVAKIISDHFEPIKDILINIVELEEDNRNSINNELVIESIKQKSKELEKYNFIEAFKFRVSVKYLLILIGCIIVFGSFFLVDSAGLIFSYSRLLNYDKEYIRGAKFSYVLVNSGLVVKKGNDLKIELSLEGKEFPGSVFIEIGNEKLLMKKGKKDLFTYKIMNLYNSVSFRFTDNIYHSDYYHIKVLPAPMIKEFTITTFPPAYTGVKSDIFTNQGNLTVPEGSNLKWDVACANTDSLSIILGNKHNRFRENEDDKFIFENTVNESFKYSFNYLNEYFNEDNKVEYFIEIIEDEYPSISVVNAYDSVNYNVVYFRGEISDDYGFKKLQFRIMDDELDSIIPISCSKNLNVSNFYYVFDFSSVKPSEYNYYFEVFDNDYLHNFKSVQSKILRFKTPEYAEIHSLENNRIEDLESLINRSNELSDEISYQLEDFKKAQINSELSEWQKTNKIKEIINKKNELTETIEKIKMQNRSLNNYRNSFTENSLDIIEKQKELEKLIDEIFSDEIKDLLEKLSELGNNFDERKFEELKKRIDYRLEDFEKQLDRNLQMIKRMYIEQKVQLLAEEIEDIADKQSDVYKALKDKDVNMQESFDKLNQERRRYDDVLDEFNKITEKNSELDSPVRFNNVDSLIQDINKSYKKVVDNLISGSKNKSVKSIKSTNESLNNLASFLRNSLQENNVSMNIENVDNLKSILKNLVYFSFAQEDILLNMDKIFNNNSEVSDILRNQNELLDIKYSFTDSLYSIADRTPQISSKVYTELLSLEYELKKSIVFIENGNYGGAKVSQQFSVKSVNTIALFIDEVIDQINKLLENAKPGGNGKGNDKSQQISMLKSSQESLKKQLEDMIKKMESGKGLSNEQLGKTLMQQEMIRSLMNDIILEGGISNKAVENLKLAENLIEQNIKDFVYNNTSRTTLLRQNSIFKYLLDAENAEMKRGFDKERESVSAKKINRGDAIEFFEDNSELKERGNEQLEILPIRVNSFYKKKYKLYKMLVDE